jgi:pimeloyl-ACP methyl ester carboxylesterase
MIGKYLVPLFLLPLFALCLLVSFAHSQNPEERRPSTDEPIFSEKIALKGLNIHFVEGGKGPPLLFLHGLGGSWKDWGSNLESLARFHHVMALDFPGFGGSDKPERNYSIEWLTDVVQDFLESRKVKRTAVIGHSMGALVAINLASRPQGPADRLVLSDAVGIGEKEDFLAYALTKKITGESAWKPLEDALRSEFKAMIADFIRDQKPKTSQEFLASLPKIPFVDKSLVPVTPAVQMAAGIIDFDARSKLSSICQPTLILWGAQDPVAPPEDAHILEEEIPQAILKIFPETGHSPMQEKPARFNEEVRKFLQAEGRLTSR